MESEPTEGGPEGERFARVKEWADGAKGRAERMMKDVERLPGGAETLDAVAHDRRIAGNLLAGALAYRVFVFLLPVALVAVSLLGFLRAARTGAPEDFAQDMGVSAYITSTVADASNHAERGRWLALGVGIVVLISSSYALAKAVRAVYALAWAVPIGKMRSAPKAVGGVVLIAIGVVLISAVAREARAIGPVVGLAVTLASAVAYAVILLAVSLALPHRNTRWYELLPGAAFAAVGTVAFQIATAYYIVPRLQSASETYGALGGATAVLLWLYLASRLIVGCAVVNANHWARKHGVDLHAERPVLSGQAI